jgi:16S rRNA (uracil1498-N3)-methyltransferase
VNLLLFERGELVASGTEVELPIGDRRARHLVAVLRARMGQRVRAGVARGPTGHAEVVALDGERIRLRLLLDGASSPRPPIDLIAAVPRPKILSRVLETAASFGVGRIDLVNAWRVDRSYLSSPRLEPDQLAAALRLGCEQGGTTWVPDAAVHRLLMPFLHGVPDRQPGELRIIAHPRAALDIEAAVPPGSAGPIAVAVGPEGGWIDREVDSFAERGFTPVRLGAPILRVDAAVAALLAQLQLLRRLAPG